LTFATKPDFPAAVTEKSQSPARVSAPGIPRLRVDQCPGECGRIEELGFARNAWEV
jgi:hypothetical protein